MIESPLDIRWTIPCLDDLPILGEGAEQSCYEIDGDLVVKIPHVAAELEELIDNTASCAEEGIGPQLWGLAVDSEGREVGVVVEKCEVIEPLIEGLSDALTHWRNSLACEYDREEIDGWIIDINEDLFLDTIETIYDSDITSQEVKDYCLDIFKFFDAADELCNYVSDMHVYNVGISPSRGYVCIDTGSYSLPSF